MKIPTLSFFVLLIFVTSISISCKKEVPCPQPKSQTQTQTQTQLQTQPQSLTQPQTQPQTQPTDSVECKDDAGKVYKTVQIGTQIWMAENLAYDVSGSTCYNDDADSCVKYGRLYTYYQALDAAPSGWHLPSDAEWKTLELYYGMTPQEVDYLSASYIDRGNKASSLRPGTPFNALYAGYHASAYDQMGYAAYFWASDTHYIRGINKVDQSIYRNYGNAASFSIRCIKD
jgi:uncharacterized protein (TIGR02145 family)